MIFLSLKTYKEATGDAVIRLLSSVKQVSKETGVTIIPIAQPTDIYRIKKELDIEVWAQHMDPIDPGRNMGWLSPYSLKEAGASGVVINHSEHKTTDENVKKILNKAREYKLKNAVIAFDLDTVIKYDAWEPDYISYEKEDNIGTGESMVKTEKDNIIKLISVLKRPFIIGAGISTGQDIKDAISLGAKGVIMASRFVLDPNPEAKLRELASGFKI